MRIWLNDGLTDAADARVAAEDAGLQHGVGLFETMLVRHGKVFRLDAHLDRMAASASALGLTLPNAQYLRQAVEATIATNDLSDARVRLTVTPGNVSLLRGEARGVTPTVLVVVTPPIAYDPAYYERGVTVVVAGPLANPFDEMQGHKTLAYWGRLRTLRDAAARGAAEAIWLSVTQHVASGSVSNVLVVRGGELLTPFARGEEVEGALPAPVLPGVTRAAVLQLAEAMGVTVKRRMLAIADLLDADEVMLTNSSWGVLPVTKVEGKTISAGMVGALTRELRTALERHIEAEPSYGLLPDKS